MVYASSLTHLVHLLRFRRASRLLGLSFLPRASREVNLLFANFGPWLRRVYAYPLGAIRDIVITVAYSFRLFLSSLLFRLYCCLAILVLK